MHGPATPLSPSSPPLAPGLDEAGPDRARRRLLVGAPALAGALAAPALPALAQAGRAPAWYAVWGCAPAGPPPAASTLSISNQTLRLVVRASHAAGRLRVRLSNEMGSSDLRLGGAHIGLRSAGANLYAGTSRQLSFGGRPGIVIPAGAPVLSDPVDLAIGAFADLAVSLYFPASVQLSTLHSAAYQTNYISSSGDHGASTALPVQRTIGSWPFLTEVESDRRAPVIVAVGDSITDGVGSTSNANRRWPDWLARRLQAELASAGPFAVVNRGIASNRLLADLGTALLAGKDLLERFDRDVLATAGVSALCVLVGINDIVYSPVANLVRAEDMAAGYGQLIERAHAHGIPVIGATLTPFEGQAYFTPARETVRRTVNAWLRSSGRFDLLVDWDAALRDPQAQTRLHRDYDSGDHLHPNDAGYQAMAAAVPLAELGALARGTG